MPVFGPVPQRPVTARETVEAAHRAASSVQTPLWVHPPNPMNPKKVEEFRPVRILPADGMKRTPRFHD